MLNINSELQKIKEYLSSKIKLAVDIVPNYDEGNKVSIKCFYKDNDKMKKAEYSFFIKYYKNKDNYANAPYLLHCNFWYGDGGSGYADKYESLHDFIKTNMLKELIDNYGIGKNNEKIEFNYMEEDTDDDIDDEEDTEIEDNDNLTIFDLESDTQDNQLSLFDEIKENDPVEDLLSYGIDEYYMNNLRGETFGLIKEELNKIPKYKEYYNKLKKYLSSFIPEGNWGDKDWNNKTMLVNDDDTIVIRGNRQYCPVYVYKMYENNFE